MKSRNTGAIVGSVVRVASGNFLEMFDFFLFGLYAQPIGKAFFNTGNEYYDTSIAFIVFWVGALMRPLGADPSRRTA